MNPDTRHQEHPEAVAYAIEALPHYLTCALWSSSPEGDRALDSDYDQDGIDTKSKGTALLTLNGFVQDNWADLQGISPEQCGHDFWLTRNGHGAGFWDRGTGDVGERLTEACRPYGESNAFAGDDDKIYLS